MAERRYTQFVKVLKPSSLKKLTIPSLDEYLDEATIKTCRGCWRVKVGRRSEGQLSFEEGWKQFVVDHHLKEGDSLLLKHVGNMVFYVSVYDTNGAEKEFAPPASSATKRMMTSHKACRASTSRSSSFNLKMSKTHRIQCCYLTIPLEFAMSNGLNEKNSMILRMSGKEWPVKLGTWQGSARKKLAFPRTTIRSAGWSEFYFDNELKDGDVCRFELQELPTSSFEPVIMNVHVTRKISRA